MHCSAGFQMCDQSRPKAMTKRKIIVLVINVFELFSFDDYWSVFPVWINPSNRFRGGLMQETKVMESSNEYM